MNWSGATVKRGDRCPTRAERPYRWASHGVPSEVLHVGFA
jgi:hypothetical protein